MWYIQNSRVNAFVDKTDNKGQITQTPPNIET